MRTPTESDFSPLPQLISHFGVPNPLDVLPRLQNQTETVNASSANLTQLHGQLHALADHIDRSSAQVQWQGDAGSGFQQRISETTTSIRAVAQATQTSVECHTQLASDFWGTVSWICLILAILAIVVGVLLAIAIEECTISGGTASGPAFLQFLINFTRVNSITKSLILDGVGALLWLAQSVIDKLNSTIITCPVPAPSGGTSAPKGSTQSSGVRASTSAASPFPGFVSGA